METMTLIYMEATAAIIRNTLQLDFISRFRSGMTNILFMRITSVKMQEQVFQALLLFCQI